VTAAQGPSFALVPEGPFSLTESTRFLEGFGPAAYPGATAGHLHLAFPVHGGEQAAGVCLTQDGNAVRGEVFGDVDVEAVRAQVARILSLDVDGRGFPAVGERDPVIGRLQAHYPGLRPVAFYSPYEAAAWAVISNRLRIVQAAAAKARLAETFGPTVLIHGERWPAFPGPRRLLEVEAVPGLPAHKLDRLHAIARATLEGELDAQLDAQLLLSLPLDEARERLKRLPGIGDFSADLVLLRGAAAPDGLPLHEPRLGRAIALAYGLAQPPTATEIGALAEQWRPYRTWGCLLLRAWLEEETHEIAG
jgi:DNA-3-methyladenine glycosylase II